ncbi:Molybdate-binding periplasmic protein precursor [compost metagenome]
METGNADAGFVYQSDAMTSQDITISFPVDPSSYTPVEYPIGILKSTKHIKETTELYDYLQSEEALGIFIKYGFSAPQSS